MVDTELTKIDLNAKSLWFKVRVSIFDLHWQTKTQTIFPKQQKATITN